MKIKVSWKDLKIQFKEIGKRNDHINVAVNNAVCDGLETFDWSNHRTIDDWLKILKLSPRWKLWYWIHFMAN